MRILQFDIEVHELSFNFLVRILKHLFTDISFCFRGEIPWIVRNLVMLQIILGKKLDYKFCCVGTSRCRWGEEVQYVVPFKKTWP